MFKPLPPVEQFGKVAVLMGGWAAERDVSLNSGAAVLNALQSVGMDAHGVDATPKSVSELKTNGFDCVFNIVHGRGGEDGTIQAALDLAGLPYTGSGVLGSALAMDKLRTKQLWSGCGLNTPKYRVMHSIDDCGAVADALGFPMMVKPSLEGSSIGISKVMSLDELPRAYEYAAQYGDVFAEQFIDGDEHTISILLDQALPVIRLETDQVFYDYAAKYERNDTRYLCPCGLPDEQERALQTMALTAFTAAAGQGWGRIDVMMDAQDQPWLIEMNTVPGMTDHSLVPMAAKQAGISYEALVQYVLTTTLKETR